MNPASSSEIETIRTAMPGQANRLLADWRIAVLVLIALWWVIYVVGLSRPALLDDADTVHAEAAREMVQRHNWVTLYANGVRYLEKAPLMYWGE
jgi:4-amino-4-deoxy-L-arabinose transferase-like glycosyltransferase